MTRATTGHVLLTADAVGGVWQYATELAAGLNCDGWRVTLAVLGPAPDSGQREALAGLASVQLVETGLPLDWLCSGAREAAAAAAGLAALAGDCGADLVHCNSPALVGAASFPVPVVAAAHGCIATWWQAARSGPLDPALQWHAEMMRRGLLGADAVVAPSASFAATLRATYRLPFLPQPVHNGRSSGVNASAGPAPIDAALTAGRLWDPVKNAALLDAAARRTDCAFMAAGATRGPNGESFAPRHLIALGQLPARDLAALLARRPVFVSAASFEPFGLAVLEAAAAGCALVLSDIATFRELWDGAALFADPGDADAFAAAIARLQRNPALRAELGEAARLRSGHYRPERTATAMAAVYRGLLDRNAEAAA